MGRVESPSVGRRQTHYSQKERGKKRPWEAKTRTETGGPEEKKKHHKQEQLKTQHL